MQKITPFLWFDGRAEEAINFYTSIFKDSKADWVSHLDVGGPKKMATGTFTLNGQQFMALDGGPMYQFTPAISLYVDVETQEELDYYWNALTESGKEIQCGWLVDKFGLSWQIVPRILTEALHSSDKQATARTMQAMMKMVKFDIEGLRKAFEGR